MLHILNITFETAHIKGIKQSRHPYLRDNKSSF